MASRALSRSFLTVVSSKVSATAAGRTSLGSDADLVVLDPATTPMLSRRTARAQSLPELLFAPAVLGDDRAIEATYVAGQRFYHRAMPGR
jgi:guanine deaminase